MDPLDLAIAAARAAGSRSRSNFGTPLNVDALEAHDIKLELDVKSQTLITGMILDQFPDHAIYGEEGLAGNQSSPFHWIVDPIDGTVNFFYGIPHFCISIALRENKDILLGVIYDPLREEMWTVRKGAPPLFNGKPCAVSTRENIAEAILSVGFSKTKATIDTGLPLFTDLVYRARKCRLMGSAALDMAYVACGRLDGYVEQSVSLWDIAAGILLIESAGGSVKIETRPDNPDKYSVVATNAVLGVMNVLGIGYDVHRLVRGRKLILGGVDIPHDTGLDGHSDADALCHAIADAALGAIGERDIGFHFPNSDELIRGISSLEILRRVALILAGQHARVLNVDSTIIAEAPKMAPHIAAMRENIAAALGLPPRRVGVKATTNETLGFAGRGEGIAALAITNVEQTDSPPVAD